MKLLLIIIYALGSILSTVTVLIALQLLFTGKNRLVWFGFALGGVFLFSHTICSVTSPNCFSSMGTFDTYFYVISPLLILSVLLLVKKMVKNLEETNLQLNRIAKYDCLTGALSRYETEKRAVYEIERADRNRHPLAFLELDIDHFKKINDCYGHEVGDEVLRGLVHCVRNELRAIDQLGRVGGEEFVVLLPESDAHEAETVANRLCEMVARHACHTSASEPLYITISIGVVVYVPDSAVMDTDPDTRFKQLMLDVDAAMYTAKKAGRNCIHSPAGVQ